MANYLITYGGDLNDMSVRFANTAGDLSIQLEKLKNEFGLSVDDMVTDINIYDIADTKVVKPLGYIIVSES